ncbi:hypothetical protein ALC53_07897 [Atta colombica]|uniref:Uncharacterized protein n=1 Tax=Atta colombica TaxID=520822 RepID=A0A195BAE1_9HYME|nr:hypothetical protein ALC53_07897 [Atta colombica]
MSSSLFLIWLSFIVSNSSKSSSIVISSSRRAIQASSDSRCTDDIFVDGSTETFNSITDCSIESLVILIKSFTLLLNSVLLADVLTKVIVGSRISSIDSMHDGISTTSEIFSDNRFSCICISFVRYWFSISINFVSTVSSIVFSSELNVSSKSSSIIIGSSKILIQESSETKCTDCCKSFDFLSLSSLSFVSIVSSFSTIAIVSFVKSDTTFIASFSLTICFSLSIAVFTDT